MRNELSTSFQLSSKNLYFDIGHLNLLKHINFSLRSSMAFCSVITLFSLNKVRKN